MRLPYLQVTSETFGKAKALAGALGIDRHRALSLILEMWSWALDLGDPNRAPDGVVMTPYAPRLLAGAVEWTGNAQELCDVLTAVGLIEKLEVGIRVRGLDRYSRTWEKNRRRTPGEGTKAAKRPDSDPVCRKPAKTGEKPARQVPVSPLISAGTGAPDVDVDVDAEEIPTESLSSLRAAAEDPRPSQMLDVWNATASGRIPKARSSDDRTPKLRRWLEKHSLEEWRLLCVRVNASPLLRGDKGEWRATLDWVLKPANLTKILDGNYDDAPQNVVVAPKGLPCSEIGCTRTGHKEFTEGRTVCQEHFDELYRAWLASQNPEAA